MSAEYHSSDLEPVESSNRRPSRGVYWLPNLFTTGTLVRRLLRHRRRHRRQLFQRRHRHFRGHGGRRPGRAGGALDQHPERFRQGVRQPVRHGGLRRRAGHRGVPVGHRAHLRLRQVLGPVRLARRFFYAVAAALRLARFNARAATADKRYFEGLPSPSAAAAVASFIWLVSEFPVDRLPGAGAGFQHHHLYRRVDGQQVLLLERQGAEHAGPHSLGVCGADPVDLCGRSRWPRCRCSPCSGCMPPPRRCTGSGAN